MQCTLCTSRLPLVCLARCMGAQSEHSHVQTDLGSWMPQIDEEQNLEDVVEREPGNENWV